MMTRPSPRRRLLRTAAGALLLVPALLTGGTGLAPIATHAASDPAALINTFIGTAGQVNDFPGADAPFGMMQWSPDTTSRPPGGGYSYDDSQITGFSLDHLSGPGCAALGDVPILPYVGAVGGNSSSPGSLSQPFTHSSESASPGYYGVTLDQPQTLPSGIHTELAVTPRTGIGRFTFPASTQSNLLFNLGGSAAGTIDAQGTIAGSNTIAGWVKSGQFCGASDVYTLYFSVQFNRPFRTFGTWNGSAVSAGTRTVRGASTGLYVTFDTSSQAQVLAKVGISFVNIGNALHNVQVEDPNWNFDAVRQATYHAWDSLLGRIAVTGGTASDQEIFYTALYHSLLHPNLFSDVNGQYIGFDNALHTVPSGHAQYANFSGWDIYRSQVQLLAMLDPSVGSDIAQSAVNDYEQSGQLPKWSLNNGEAYIMVGDPADPILAGLYAFGATNFDTATALHAMIAEATNPNNIRPGLNYYESLHYTPQDGRYACCNWYGSVSSTLEYDTADEALSQFASALGDTADAQRFLQRAQNWQYLFSAADHLVRPKNLDGQFVTPFMPENYQIGYVEGNAYQYTPLVPFNIHGVMALMGGRSAYDQYLNHLFAPFYGPDGDASLAAPSNTIFTQSSFGGYVVPFSWQGNEPSTATPWEYDFIGTPYNTQDVVRRIALNLFTTQPDGLPGNDDLGEMSSWYVWAALGMYPEIPGSAYLALGSPLFTSITVTRGSGQVLRIIAPQATDSNRFIQSMTVNGSPWGNAYLPPSIVHNGGTITAILSASPNPNFGVEPSAAPPSYGAGQLPALGFTLPSGQIPAAPTGFSTKVGAQNATDQVQVVYWTAHPGTGVTITPSAGTLVVPADGTATSAVKVTAAPATTQSTATFDFRSGGQALPAVVDTVAAGSSCAPPAPSTATPQPDPLIPFYNNVGTGDDCTGGGDFDQLGSSYSTEALTDVGLAPGAMVPWHGFTFQWPLTGATQPNNVIAGGQTIPLAAPSGARALGFLGSASNGGQSGNATITYSDGTQQNVLLGMSDWQLGSGGSSPQFGNSVVAVASYHDSFPGGVQSGQTYVFGTQISLLAGKTPVSITLPSGFYPGQVHLFALAFK